MDYMKFDNSNTGAMPQWVIHSYLSDTLTNLPVNALPIYPIIIASRFCAVPREQSPSHKLDLFKYQWDHSMQILLKQIIWIGAEKNGWLINPESCTTNVNVPKLCQHILRKFIWADPKSSEEKILTAKIRKKKHSYKKTRIGPEYLSVLF
mgnify:CR=1 FL=1